MRSVTNKISVDDWVYSDSPGIWKVYRVVQDVQRMRFNLGDRRRVDRRQLVFSKRFLDNAWNPAFTGEMANGEFVHPLSEEDKKRLEKFIVQNPAVYQKFELFEPDTIDTAMDLRLEVPTLVSHNDAKRLVENAFCGIETGLTNDEVLQRLEANQLATFITMLSGNAILRFLSKGHEIRNGEYIFREVQLMITERLPRQ